MVRKKMHFQVQVQILISVPRGFILSGNQTSSVIAFSEVHALDQKSDSVFCTLNKTHISFFGDVRARTTEAYGVISP